MWSKSHIQTIKNNWMPQNLSKYLTIIQNLCAKTNCLAKNANCIFYTQVSSVIMSNIILHDRNSCLIDSVSQTHVQIISHPVTLCTI